MEERMFATRTETPLLVAFLTLNGFAQQSQRVGDLALATTLDDYFALVTKVIETAGGTVVKFIGDGVLVACTPVTADSVVAAILELKLAVDQFMQERHWNCRLVARVHFGPVVAGPLGPGKHRRFDVVGRTVNITARLDTVGVGLSAEAFRQLRTETRTRFKKHTPPITYIRAEDSHRAMER
jgi:class 3 adenylate cyclase